MSTTEIVLLVLAKAPEAGRVKTRLCPPATPAQAARIAAASLLDTLDAVRAVPGGRPVVALTGDLTNAEQSAELAVALRGLPVVRQRGDTLGARIAAAHADTADLLPGLPVLQIGMDTPQIDRALLADCQRRLRAPEVDAVLGPARDGGWWALGLRDPHAAAALVDVPTSRSDTGALTAHALRGAGLRIDPLFELSDVDTMSDAEQVSALIPHSRFAAAVQELT